MTSQFLTQLAGQLAKGKNPAVRRVVQSVLDVVVVKFDAGRYAGMVEAEADLRAMVDRACLRLAPKRA
jgi:hypothetical protein